MPPLSVDQDSTPCRLPATSGEDGTARRPERPLRPAEARRAITAVDAWATAGIGRQGAPLPFSGSPAVAAVVLFIALTIAVVNESTTAWDTQITLSLHGLSSPGLTITMTLLTAVGLLPSMAVLLVLSWAWLLRARRRGDAVWLGGVMLGEGMIDDVLKLLVHRPRPTLLLRPPAVGFAYPSGHAMATLCLGAALLALAWPHLGRIVRWSLVLLLVLLLAGIGTSRVYLGLHYPSDVVGGWLAGVAWLGIATPVLQRATAALRNWAGLPQLRAAGDSRAHGTPTDA